MRFSLGFLALVSLFAATAHAVVPPFFSAAGAEHVVSFEGVYRASDMTLDRLGQLSAEERVTFQETLILPTIDFLFGPLVNRNQASPKRIQEIQVAWDRASSRAGKLEVPYHYEGTWILSREAASQPVLEVPVPYSVESALSAKWKACTDSAPEHQTEDFYWYFWDPARSGCKHKEGREYFVARALIGAATPQTERTYPEYDRLLRADGPAKRLGLTIAFGYVEDAAKPNPDRDGDYGIAQYREFLQGFRARWVRSLGLKESPILQKEYRAATQPKLVIGHRFTGRVNGAEVTLNIVSNAGIDQMDLFAKSFAHDHDGVFAWFGHSRVGSGFDADRFEQLLKDAPDYYSLTDAYQIIYWGGCNSYSYYSTPFFRLKGGTRNLDIIANGLPSLFSLNAGNAEIVVENFLDPKPRASYQDIVRSIEARAKAIGTKVLAVVLGDEDNTR
jgi:hypothetical protein